MDLISGLNNIDPEVLEEMYKSYKVNPEKADPAWKLFFSGFDLARQSYHDEDIILGDEFKVINLITAYRQRGHYFTKTNPVRQRRTYSPTLGIENFGLRKEDLNREFVAGSEIGIGKAKLKDIVEVLQQTYCVSVGVEYMYIRKPNIVEWLRKKIETTRNTPSFPVAEKQKILLNILRAVHFEKFIHKRFPGQKSFSLEGAEALIPALMAIIERGAELGYSELVMGMPHRGRLNVLSNIFQKPYSAIFSEFEGKHFDDIHLLGDVKYHLGYSSDYKNEKGYNIHLTLVPNPSHLEAVGPVVEGIVRAKSELYYKDMENSVIPVIIHGDASVSGQGIVYELVQMSELKGYKTGGTIHIVVNNQLGFTTNYLDGRSGIYSTDVAKIIQSPIFHVNGDDVEAVVHTMLLAFEYRHEFKKDVFIDLLCYRKYGHNESDEPRFTQPVLYKIIEKHPDPLQIYLEKLIGENEIITGFYKEAETKFINKLEKELEIAKKLEVSVISPFLKDIWKHFIKADTTDHFVTTDTRISKEEILSLAAKITTLPVDKNFFEKIKKLQLVRQEMMEGEGSLDWAMAELLAYASLLNEGYAVRISGQDVKRGTFSHRHAVLTVEDSEEEYIPLDNISKQQAVFQIFNSLLSEYAVLGFEYGYALAAPETLTVWEAQFGDFSNGAQIITDQFIVSAEEKWNVMNGLVMYLPHGYEGQGPEHSSARPERFLQLCAGNNIQLVNCSTPANLFHLLRRQLLRPFRKPLIIFTPKSLLRQPACRSKIADFTEGVFIPVIDDPEADKNEIQRLILCTGKIFYELIAEKRSINITDTAIIRIEQWYPFPESEINAVISSYPNTKQILWVQEEPKNMGVWLFMKEKMKNHDILPVSRPESASPATGSAKLHKEGQRKIIDKAFGKCTCEDKLLECSMKCVDNEEYKRW